LQFIEDGVGEMSLMVFLGKHQMSFTVMKGWGWIL
jgi:hypothetical protein